MYRIMPVLLVIVLCASAQVSRYALIIGQNNGGAEVGKLQYAERDARRVAEVLRSIGDFSKENTTLVLNVDSSDVQSAMERIGTLIRSRGEQEKALFLLYYSGHADVNSLLLGKTKYSLEKIQKMVSTFPAAFRIAVFDACQSGVVTAYKGGTRAEPFYLQNNTSLVKGQVIIASASANERAQESPSLKGSVFTFHWINGLKGSADISSDNQVTLNEAYQYAYRKTIETSALATGEIQHPVYRFNFTGQGDVILTNLNKSESGIVLGKDCEGKFLVLSEDYLDVYADFSKERGREVLISLVHGAYTIVNACGGDVGTLALTLKRRSVMPVTQAMFIPNTLTESRIKGHAIKDSVAQYVKSLPRGYHQYSFGLGSGFVLYPTFLDDNWDSDVLLQMTNSYSVRQNVSLFLDGSGLLFSKSGAVHAGLDYLHFNGVADCFIGAGAGMEYAYHQYEEMGDALALSLTAHTGFITAIGKNTSLQVRIPFTAVLKETPDYRIGIDFSVCFRVGK